MRTETQFAAGYQQALRDVLAAGEQDVIHGIVQWIKDNCNDQLGSRRALALYDAITELYSDKVALAYNDGWMRGARYAVEQGWDLDDVDAREGKIAH